MPRPPVIFVRYGPRRRVGLGPTGYVLALDAAAQLCKGAGKSAARFQ